MKARCYTQNGVLLHLNQPIISLSISSAFDSVPLWAICTETPFLALLPPHTSPLTFSSTAPFSPLPWTPHFTTSLQLTSPNTPYSYHTYFTPPSDPKVGPLFVFHHGAGASGLSFASCVSSLHSLDSSVGVLAPDCRGHGETVLKPGQSGTFEETKNGALNMSLSVLAEDLETTLTLLQVHQNWPELPNLILVGHSLGGAVVTEVAKRGNLGRKVLGYAVLDVVEGSAMDALRDMQGYLESRPKIFRGLEEGVEWQ